MRSNTELTEHHSLVEIAARCPKAVFGLVTALSFHNLTTENPETVWMFLPRNSQAPKTNLMLDIFWASDESYAAGVETHLIEGVPVKITNPAKTVVDCFKFRNRVGIPLAVEALKDAWRQRKVTTRDLCEYAEICRMTNVMRPYFEAIIS
jgi:predicted transcriptional regulator of viral defense system